MKPAGFWIKGAEVHPRTDPDCIVDHHDVSARSDLSLHVQDDIEETVLYEEQFVMPATPSEASLSDREDEERPESRGLLYAQLNLF